MDPTTTANLGEGGVPARVGIEGADAHQPVDARLALAPPMCQGTTHLLCLFFVGGEDRKYGMRWDGMEICNGHIGDVLLYLVWCAYLDHDAP